MRMELITLPSDHRWPLVYCMGIFGGRGGWLWGGGYYLPALGKGVEKLKAVLFTNILFVFIFSASLHAKTVLNPQRMQGNDIQNYQCTSAILEKPKLSPHDKISDSALRLGKLSLQLPSINSSEQS